MRNKEIFAACYNLINLEINMTYFRSVATGRSFQTHVCPIFVIEYVRFASGSEIFSIVFIRLKKTFYEYIPLASRYEYKQCSL